MALDITLHGLRFQSEGNAQGGKVKVTTTSPEGAELTQEQGAQIAAFVNIVVCGGNEDLITEAIEQMVEFVNKHATEAPK